MGLSYVRLYIYTLQERVDDSWLTVGCFRDRTLCTNSIHFIYEEVGELLKLEYGEEPLSFFRCITLYEENFRLHNSIIHYDNKTFPLDPDTITLNNGTVINVNGGLSIKD